MQLLTDLGQVPVWLRSLALGMAVRYQLLANTLINVRLLQINRLAHRKSGGRIPLVPPLYLSGVEYREEPQNWEHEHFDCLPVVYGRKWGDCDDLGPILAAELRVTGQDPRASIMVKWKTQPNNKRLYHVVVRRSNVPRSRIDGKRFFGDQHGVYEDPSRVLGMGRNHKTATAHQGL